MMEACANAHNISASDLGELRTWNACIVKHLIIVYKILITLTSMEYVSEKDEKDRPSPES